MGVYVVGELGQEGEGYDGPERTQRHGQQHREWHRPALVQRRQQQKYEHDAEAEDDDSAVAGADFLAAQGRKVEAVLGGQGLGGYFLQGGDGLAGTVAGLGVAIDFGGAE